MMKTKLARAITMTLAGGALSLGAVSTASATATTMYNAYKFDSAATNTDGWVYGGIGYGSNPAGQSGIVNPNYTGPTLYYPNTTDPLPIGVASFIGIGGNSTATAATPFGYIGSSSLNWAVEFTGGGYQTAQISDADAAKYGFDPEVDTGAGAWMDDGTGSPPLGQTGWKHQTDIGLIKTDVDSMITLNLTRVGGVTDPGLYNDNFGVTIFSGMDTNTAGYVHHGAWNSHATPSTGTAPGSPRAWTWHRHRRLHSRH